MSEKFHEEIQEMLKKEPLMGLPKYPNKNNIKQLKKKHIENMNKINGYKKMNSAFYVETLKDTLEGLRNNTNQFQISFNQINQVNDQLNELKAEEAVIEKKRLDAVAIEEKINEKRKNHYNAVKELYDTEREKYNNKLEEMQKNLE